MVNTAQPLDTIAVRQQSFQSVRAGHGSRSSHPPSLKDILSQSALRLDANFAFNPSSRETVCWYCGTTFGTGGERDSAAYFVIDTQTQVVDSYRPFFNSMMILNMYQVLLCHLRLADEGISSYVTLYCAGFTCKPSESRETPNRLDYVFGAGAVAGVAASILQTPIEVVKCLDQVAHKSESGGSIRIARQVLQTRGIRGLYIGLKPTALHDGLSSGIFFACCEHPLYHAHTLVRQDHQSRMTIRQHRLSRNWADPIQDGTAGGIAGLFVHNLRTLQS